MIRTNTWNVLNPWSPEVRAKQREVKHKLDFINILSLKKFNLLTRNKTLIILNTFFTLTSYSNVYQIDLNA